MRTHVNGGGVVKPHVDVHTENYLILSSSHAKKLASFLPEFRLWTAKSENFSAT